MSTDTDQVSTLQIAREFGVPHSTVLAKLLPYKPTWKHDYLPDPEDAESKIVPDNMAIYLRANLRNCATPRPGLVSIDSHEKKTLVLKITPTRVDDERYLVQPILVDAVTIEAQRRSGHSWELLTITTQGRPLGEDGVPYRGGRITPTTYGAGLSWSRGLDDAPEWLVELSLAQVKQG